MTDAQEKPQQYRIMLRRRDTYGWMDEQMSYGHVLPRWLRRWPDHGGGIFDYPQAVCIVDYLGLWCGLDVRYVPVPPKVWAGSFWQTASAAAWDLGTAALPNPVVPDDLYRIISHSSFTYGERAYEYLGAQMRGKLLQDRWAHQLSTLTGVFDAHMAMVLTRYLQRWRKQERLRIVHVREAQQDACEAVYRRGTMINDEIYESYSGTARTEAWNTFVDDELAAAPPPPPPELSVEEYRQLMRDAAREVSRAEWAPLPAEPPLRPSEQIIRGLLVLLQDPAALDVLDAALARMAEAESPVVATAIQPPAVELTRIDDRGVSDVIGHGG